MNDAEVKLQVKIDDSKANTAMNTLKTKTDSLSKSFADAGKKLTLGLTLPIAGLITAGVKYNSEIEQLSTSFEVMTGSAEKAGEVIEKLKEVGAKTPYELTGLAQTTQILMQYGMTADEAYEATINLGDIAQGSAEKMQSIALAYGQMSSAGKVNMQDIKQMINAGFNPLQAIVDKTGKTMAQVTAEYEAGTISVQDITEAMAYATSENGRYFQSMEKQSQTVAGKISTLKDSFNEAAGELTVALLPVINKLIDGLTSVTNWFTSLDEETQQTILTVLGLVAAIGPLLTIVGNLTKVIGLANTAMSLLAANPVVLGIAAITASLWGLYKAYKAVQEAFGEDSSGTGGGGGFSGSASGISHGGGGGTTGSFAVGTDYVPRDGLAYLHEGERIVPKKYNSFAGNFGGSEPIIINLTTNAKVDEGILFSVSDRISKEKNLQNGFGG